MAKESNTLLLVKIAVFSAAVGGFGLGLGVGVHAARTSEAQGVATSRVRAVIQWTPLALGIDGAKFGADAAQFGDGVIRPGTITAAPGVPAGNAAVLNAYLTGWQATHHQPAGWVTLTSERFVRGYTVHVDGTVATQTPERLAETLTAKQVVDGSSCPLCGPMQSSGGNPPMFGGWAGTGGEGCPAGNICSSGGNIGDNPPEAADGFGGSGSSSADDACVTPIACNITSTGGNVVPTATTGSGTGHGGNGSKS